ncbi:MAG: AMP-binding protein, partial [Caulobacteraceae bacterium]
MHYRALKEVWGELTAPGAPFEVATIEVRGAPMRTFKNAPPSVRDLWLSTAQFGPRDYIVYQDERVTYAEAHRQVAAVANWLKDQGVVAGDRVAIAMRNYPEWMLIYWACVSIGVAAVGMNAWWVTEEMAYAFADSAPKVMFCDAERLARVAERPDMAAGMTLVAVRAEPSLGAVAWSEVLAHPGALPDVAVEPDADACIFYTSGTT